MSDHKRTQDTISENEYTRRMKSASTRPQDDSPGDSETDAGVEFEMGIDYSPDPTKEIDPDTSGDPNPFSRDILEVSEDTKVISSEQPAPWMDQESPSSTH